MGEALENPAGSAEVISLHEIFKPARRFMRLHRPAFEFDRLCGGKLQALCRRWTLGQTAGFALRTVLSQSHLLCTVLHLGDGQAVWLDKSCGSCST
eukprot:jgi/Botrbrau1/12818/Bobra.20_1s0009.1